MSIAKILVPVNGAGRDAIAIAAALEAAKPFNAHVRLLAVHPEPALSIPNVGVPLTAEALQAIVDGQIRYAEAANTRVRGTLTDACSRHGATIAEARGNGVTCSFRHKWGDFVRVVVKAAALSDLVVLGPIHWSEAPELNDAFLEILRKVQRPVLVAKVPPTGGCATIALGWDGSAAAAHAIQNAVPFLKQARKVVILAAHRSGRAAAAVEPVTAYLTRHGIASECRTADCGARPVGEELVAQADAMQADLLVAGGYGHDQVWEALFGGVTASLVAAPTLPILLGH